MGLESFRLRAFAATCHIVALGFAIDASRITPRASAGPSVSVLGRLTRRFGLKGETATISRLRWGIHPPLTIYPTGDG